MTLTAKDLIESLNQLGESASIEAKRGHEIGRSIHETISALSNEPDLGGGYILLGVEKDEGTLFPTYSVTGLDDIEKLKRDLSSQCASVFNTPIRPKISEEKVNGKNVLIIFVPEAQPQDKPFIFSPLACQRVPIDASGRAIFAVPTKTFSYYLPIKIKSHSTSRLLKRRAWMIWINRQLNYTGH